jgi:glycosyltransferase involved in cell wall biosynthesis
MRKFPKVLVGCITWDRMEKYLQRYIQRIKSLTYPNYEILLVDSSKTNYYYNKLSQIKGITVLKSKHIESPPEYIENYQNALNTLRKYFLLGDYQYLISIEQDMLPPPNIIESLMFYDKPVVGTPYRMTDSQWCVYDYDIDKDEYDFETYPPLIKKVKIITSRRLWDGLCTYKKRSTTKVFI